MSNLSNAFNEIELNEYNLDIYDCIYKILSLSDLLKFN